MNVLGASVREDTVTFAVWAPRCRSVEVAMEGRRPQPMTRGADDVFTLTMANVAPGTRYRYRLDGGRHRPDPPPPGQPEGGQSSSAPAALRLPARGPVATETPPVHRLEGHTSLM